MIRRRTNDRSTNRHQPSGIWRKCTDLRALKQIHASLVVRGFNSNVPALRELIFAAAITISGTVNYALQVFSHISEPDLFMWNTVIRGAAQSLRPLNAVSVFSQMDSLLVRPDNYTYSFVLKACKRLSWVKTGFCIHGKIVRFGFESNTFVRNTLIYFHASCGDLGVARYYFDGCAKRDVVAWSALTAGYARRGELAVARQLFDEMPAKDLVSWNVMITAYTKQGDMASARKLFDEVPERDVVTWNAMIAGYVLCGSNKEALQMFQEMRRVGEKPDEVTILSLLSACADMGDLEAGEKMHFLLSELCPGGFSVLLGNALVDLYAKCGNVDRALAVFQDMKEKDVSSWNSVIGGSAFHGHAEESINLFREMQRLKIKPDEITMVGVLAACSHAGKVEEGRRYFCFMIDEYGIEPDVRHYGCMVDMLGRAGLVDEAFAFIRSMEIAPNAIIWRTLLGACRVHGNVELGKLANEKLLTLRRDETGDYVLLSNLYALEGKWDGAEEVRRSMDDTGLKKEPGYSLIDADNRALECYLFDSKPSKNARPKVSEVATRG